jgi:hypothetical protein
LCWVLCGVELNQVARPCLGVPRPRQCLNDCTVFWSLGGRHKQFFRAGLVPGPGGLLCLLLATSSSVGGSPCVQCRFESCRLEFDEKPVLRLMGKGGASR